MKVSKKMGRAQTTEVLCRGERPTVEGGKGRKQQGGYNCGLKKQRKKKTQKKEKTGQGKRRDDELGVGGHSLGGAGRAGAWGGGTQGLKPRGPRGRMGQLQREKEKKTTLGGE